MRSDGLPLRPCPAEMSGFLHPSQPGWNRLLKLRPSFRRGAGCGVPWGVCAHRSAGACPGGPACGFPLSPNAHSHNWRAVSKSLPHLPGLQMTSHQSACNQGGPGSLRLPRCPWGLRSGWGTAAFPDSLASRSSSQRPLFLRV